MFLVVGIDGFSTAASKEVFIGLQNNFESLPYIQKADYSTHGDGLNHTLGSSNYRHEISGHAFSVRAIGTSLRICTQNKGRHFLTNQELCLTNRGCY